MMGGATSEVELQALRVIVTLLLADRAGASGDPARFLNSFAEFVSDGMEGCGFRPIDGLEPAAARLLIERTADSVLLGARAIHGATRPTANTGQGS